MFRKVTVGVAGSGHPAGSVEPSSQSGGVRYSIEESLTLGKLFPAEISSSVLTLLFPFSLLAFPVYHAGIKADSCLNLFKLLSCFCHVF